ncbi:unnamed protein product [Adineta steineri]|uniref:Uncharacterized protein n=1 Tax=Adineta steineri TaxID=433720 RepID=A0A814JC39_9BILA|nr:unnamed protein product [Adineta steineri]
MATNQEMDVEHQVNEEDIHALRSCYEALQNETRVLKECCETLRNEINELKGCVEVFRNGSHTIKNCCEGLRNENQKLKERVWQLEIPLRNTTEINDIEVNAKWIQNGITVAGGHGFGNGLNQLWAPHGFSVDENHQTIYIADSDNHRILEWNYSTLSGRVVAGGNGKGNRKDQLDFPRNVIIDTDNLIICDWGNRRVVRWPRRNGTEGEIIISDIECFGGLAIDESRNLYVADFQKNEVKRWKQGEVQGTVVAGGHGDGNDLNQLNGPTYIFVDRNHSIYISDKDNHRVMMWKEGAQEGVIVAGGRGKGNNLTQLKYPYGMVVDQLGTVYVADSWNNRIIRWSKGAKEGSIVVGGNGEGEQPNQLSYPIGLLFDRQGHLYVADHNNHRILKFQIDSSNSSS